METGAYHYDPDAAVTAFRKELEKRSEALRAGLNASRDEASRRVRERVAEYLILLSRGQVRPAGAVKDLLAAHPSVASLEELALAYLRETQTSEVTR